MRPHPDDGNILYDNPNNENFPSKLEKFQYIEHVLQQLVQSKEL